jgi:hypothetical protein
MSVVITTPDIITLSIAILSRMSNQGTNIQQNDTHHNNTSIMTLFITSISIMTVIIMTPGIITLAIMIFLRMIHSGTDIYQNDIQHYNTRHNDTQYKQ